MKVRDSGMPPQDYWETLFNVPGILDAFGFGPATGDVVELGCGYGTFTLPLARRIRGTVHTVDIESDMVTLTRQRAAQAQLTNLKADQRDVLTNGFGRPPGSCDAALLFNILHAEDPVAFLQAARDVVRPGGLVAVIHWRSDVTTPRGPALEIRPRPNQIVAWAGEAGLVLDSGAFLLPPWHFGLKLLRT
ncbi:class I SAM-dependent methyltransferase [Oleiharenicola lentus]|jgi:SAM-dependent methyltransferase|uniref:Class I SAM-dependent methyltransferase n=1 Tax=Oleiharenicola lentus TaxID=2508720 RepID=A0A4Q1C861_9BACT|nr:class I SAM-dependent methyltransferase [Oleiharenicola lentus]RXK55127.1 class I SAM-dependent methyltransferase [Oleiharenicola lentus]